VIGGVGIAGLALGAVMGGLTMGQKGVILEHCGMKVGARDDAGCDPIGLAAVHSARPLGLASTIGFIAGGTAVAVGTVLLVTAPRPSAGATARREPARWMTVGVLSAGKAGVVLGGSGAW